MSATGRELRSTRAGIQSSDRTYNHYPIGWAHPMDAPFQWTKQVASHFGGTRNGLVINWPKRIKVGGEIRPQFHHVIDVVPNWRLPASKPVIVERNATEAARGR